MSGRRRLRAAVRDRPVLKRLALWARRMSATLRPASLARLPWFFLEWGRFRRAGGRSAFWDLYPCLGDRTASTAVDPYYFYEGIWAFRRILAGRPTQHVDVGSSVQLVGMLTTVSPVTFVDIRPLALPVAGLTMKPGSLLQLPFEDGCVHSLSCLNVLEHVGLGRYGDPIDPAAREKACRELQRVMARGGRLYLSTPVGRSRVHFNAHRVSGVSEILTAFDSMKLEELSLVDTDGAYSERIRIEDAAREAPGRNDFALGLFLFERV